MKKNLRELQALLPPGYRIVWGRKHGLIVDANGEPLRKPGGIPVMAPGSPSDVRHLKNMRANVRQAVKKP